MTIASINPATNEKLRQVEPQTKDMVIEAISTAHEAYHHWRNTTFAHRKNCLLKFAKLLRADTDAYARAITLDMGKRISESQYEIEYCANIVEFYANGTEQFLADQKMEVEDANAYIHYESLGVLTDVTPDNPT